MRRLLLLAALAVLALAQLPKPSGGSGGGSSSGCIASGTAVQKGNGAGGCTASSVTDNGIVVATIEGLQAKSLVLGDGNSSAIDYMQGKTSGGSAWGVTDTALASPVVFLMPNAAPTSGQLLSTGAVVTCSSLTATFAAGSPTNCVQVTAITGGTNQASLANLGPTTLTAGKTYWMSIGSSAVRDNASFAESTAQTRMPRAGTISNLQTDVRATTSASSVTFTVELNGAQCTSPSTISIVIAGATGISTPSDTTHSCAFAANDLVNLKIVTSVGADNIGTIGSVSFTFTQ